MPFSFDIRCWLPLGLLVLCAVGCKKGSTTPPPPVNRGGTVRFVNLTDSPVDCALDGMGMNGTLPKLPPSTKSASKMLSLKNHVATAGEATLSFRPKSGVLSTLAVLEEGGVPSLQLYTGEAMKVEGKTVITILDSMGVTLDDIVTINGKKQQIFSDKVSSPFEVKEGKITVAIKGPNGAASASVDAKLNGAYSFIIYRSNKGVSMLALENAVKLSPEAAAGSQAQ